MLKLIYGPKGFGKTKIILDDVNAAAEKANGNVVFITDKKFDSVNVNFNVRCIYTEEYGVDTVEKLEGFIYGLIAGNSDIEYVFIDGISRMANAAPAQLEDVLKELEQLGANGVNFEITVSAAKEDLPKFMLKYID
ncbi:MAG: hypothetical protein IJ706_04275 [Clostridia bacterium]|nr:hypothetical protein [Clostridia bacterium]